jgi:APA family basic amino acid/polyamine antiporter
MSLTMTGVVHYTQLGVSDPVAVGVDRIVELHGWSAAAKSSISFFVKLGALAGLTSVVLVMMLGQTRIFYSMSKDGLIPYFHKIHPKFGTPSTATIVTGLGVALATGFMSLNLVGELVSIGTLLAFVLVCLGVFILRFTDPLVPRPFKTPLFWFTAPAGIASSIYVMSYLPGDTWLRLMGWLCFGMAFYFFYGIKHSVLNKGKLANLSNNQTALLGGVWLVGAFLCLYQLLKHHI